MQGETKVEADLTSVRSFYLYQRVSDLEQKKYECVPVVENKMGNP